MSYTREIHTKRGDALRMKPRRMTSSDLSDDIVTYYGRPRVPSIVVRKLAEDSMVATTIVNEHSIEGAMPPVAEEPNMRQISLSNLRRWRLPIIIMRMIGKGKEIDSETSTDDLPSDFNHKRSDGVATSSLRRGTVSPTPSSYAITSDAEPNNSMRSVKPLSDPQASLTPTISLRRKSNRNRSRKRSSSSAMDRGWKPEIPFENILTNFSANKKRRKKTATALKNMTSLGLLPHSLAPLKQRRTDYDEINIRMLRSIKILNYNQLGKDHIKDFTITYHDKDLESKFSHLRDELFKSNLVLSCIIVSFILAVEICIHPAVFYVTYIKCAVFIVFYGILMFLAVAEDHKSLPRSVRYLSCCIQESLKLRYLLIYIALIINLMLTVSGMVTCHIPMHDENRHECVTLNCASLNETHSYEVYDGGDSSICNYPNFLFYNGLLMLITCSVFLRVHNFVKLLTYAVVGLTYGIIIMAGYLELFDNFETRKRLETDPCNHATYIFVESTLGLIFLILFGITLYYQSRRIEYTTRLDFLRKLEAKFEVEGMKRLRHHNHELLRNILPDHVATHFLERVRDDEELYSQSHECVGVVFASIPNFSHNGGSDSNIDSLKLLNEIFFDIDQLIGQERFRCLEKIKTIGSTYMAASGLTPHNIMNAVSTSSQEGGSDVTTVTRNRGDSDMSPLNRQNNSETREESDIKTSDISHLCMLAHFALLLQKVIADINVHSFTNFKLRVGIAFGPVVAGVIGAGKPQYDIWGRIVNLASRMESTGVPGEIQVPEEMCRVLEKRGFHFVTRGEVQVKGLGNVRTYFLTGCTPEAAKQAGVDRALSNLGIGFGADGNLQLGDASSNGGHHSLAQIVFSLVQARQRHKRYGTASGRSASLGEESSI